MTKKAIGKIEMPPKLFKKELIERAYKQKWRELKIAKTRASVLKSQIIRSYEILENIRFDFLSDTMFRDYFVRAKSQLEGVMCDFLLSDSYWEKRIEEHRKMTPEEYHKKVDDGAESQPIKSKKK